MKQTSRENFLIIGPSWIGDMVMAQSLFISLKTLYVGCKISVLAPQWTHPLLDRMPEVDRSIGLPVEHGELKLSERRALGKSLRVHEFSSAIVLPNSFKSALVPVHAKIPRRLGWRGEWRNLLLTDCRKLNKRNFPRMVQRFVALAYQVSAEPPPNIPRPELTTDIKNTTATLQEFGLETSQAILAICPGAQYGDSKQWPATHYATLARAVMADGWQVWIFGSAKDTAIAGAIEEGIKESTLDAHSLSNLAGKTSLAQVIDLMSAVSVVVSNDSGLMHIAAALHKPVVGIYGSTSPEFTPPLAQRVKMLVSELDCWPCFKRECPYGHLRCLRDLDPLQVINSVAELHRLP